MLERNRLRSAGRLSHGFYRVPVTVLFNWSRGCATVGRKEFEVIARSAAEAANWVRDNEPGVWDRPETEIHAWGPKGGHVERYIGWDSAMMAVMSKTVDLPRCEQLELNV